MNKVTSHQFYRVWHEIVLNRKDEMLKIWRNNSKYTSCIKGYDNSIISEIANKLELISYEKDYYSLDSILYKIEDLTPEIGENSFWFRNIRVAFEHENDFNGGLYQEVSHLTITNCDLRVLVTYPNCGEDGVNEELNYFHEIIRGNSQSKNISDDESFLIIFGYEDGFNWDGFIFKEDSWLKIN